MSIDGCPAQCATKNIKAAKGRLVRNILVTDVLRQHKGLKPRGVIKLNAEGEKLASLLAGEATKEIDRIVGDEE